MNDMSEAEKRPDTFDAAEAVLPEAERSPILRDGETVWKRATATHAAVLFDAARYFGVLRGAMRQARHSIFIAGWDIDSRTRLVGPSGEAPDGAPEALGAFLGHLATARDDLDIYVLPWDYSLLFMRERELLPMVALGWKTPERVHVCVDGTAPTGASHHQKLVVIDDSLAFCGGLDLTLRRWDTDRHDREHPARVDPGGAAYGPYHDYQVMVDGDAARALGEIVRQRWTAAAETQPKPASKAICPWPDDVRPDFESVAVGISRTAPESLAGPPINEVETLYNRSIAAARKTLYIENQYLNCDAFAESLAAHAAAHPDLDVVLITNQDAGGWLEERTMGMGRRRFMAILASSSAADRFRVLRSMVRDGDTSCEIHIHAKVTIVDDTLLRVGSSNINQRSMGLDTECDLAIEAANDDERQRIVGIRNRMIGHHLGITADAFEALVESHGSVIAAIDAHDGDTHTLEPIDPHHPEAVFNDDIEASLAIITDPKAPPHHAALSATFEMQDSGAEPTGVPIRVLAAVAVAVLLLILWYATPIANFTDVETLEPYFQRVADSGWALVLVPLVIVLASVFFFPITILIALTGMTLGPFLGSACATAGSLGSAALAFGIGTLLGQNGLRRMMGKRLNRISKRMAHKGVLAIAGVRLLPVAPFTAINLIAGATHIRFGEFMAGTALGMAPGILIVSALGDRLREVWQNPSPQNIVALGLIAVAWIAIAVGLQVLVSRRRRKRSG
jgi:uncharacterized membrane protein YdjX (TVP38/TMEM64 family)/phosphatidylserine/phosphatidylglycerophosphate/cardiolipin synthase-like enzyme